MTVNEDKGLGSWIGGDAACPGKIPALLCTVGAGDVEDGQDEVSFRKAG